jgi:hypothetical protein
MAETINVYEILGGKPEGKIPFEELGVNGRIMLK